MKKIIVTVDGPAASGKERIAKFIALKWKLKHLDSGILYRKLAYHLITNSIDINSPKKVVDSILSFNLVSFKKNKFLRDERISLAASKIAVIKKVREYINNFQLDFVKNNNSTKGFVVDGRDIGSVVFKNANLKLYIEVNEENRAKRRYKQLIDSGQKSIYPKILREIKLRDKKDKNRKNSPLIVPNGAIIINNNNKFSDTTKQINKLMEKLIT